MVKKNEEDCLLIDLGCYLTKVKLLSEEFPMFTIKSSASYSDITTKFDGSDDAYQENEINSKTSETGEMNEVQPLFDTILEEITNKDDLADVQYRFGEEMEFEEEYSQFITFYDEDGNPRIPVLLGFLDYLKYKFDFPKTLKNLFISTGCKIPRIYQDNIIQTIKKETQFSNVYYAPSYEVLISSLNEPTGVLFEMGYSKINIIPFNNNHLLLRNIIETKIGGNSLISYMKKLLERQYPFINSSMFEDFVHTILQTKCTLVEDFEDKLKDEEYCKSLIETLELPHIKQNITLSSEKIIVPELIFNPKLNNLSEISLLQAIMECIKKIPPNSRKSIFSKIFIVGGLAQIKNLGGKLKKEFEKIPLLSGSELLIDEKSQYKIIDSMKDFFLKKILKK